MKMHFSGEGLDLEPVLRYDGHVDAREVTILRRARNPTAFNRVTRFHMAGGVRVFLNGDNDTPRLVVEKTGLVNGLRSESFKLDDIQEVEILGAVPVYPGV